MLPSGEMVDFAPPRALTTEEVEAFVQDFCLVARNVINAGTFLAARSKQTHLSWRATANITCSYQTWAGLYTVQLKDLCRQILQWDDFAASSGSLCFVSLCQQLEKLWFFIWCFLKWSVHLQILLCVLILTIWCLSVYRFWWDWATCCTGDVLWPVLEGFSQWQNWQIWGLFWEPVSTSNWDDSSSGWGDWPGASCGQDISILWCFWCIRFRSFEFRPPPCQISEQLQSPVCALPYTTPLKDQAKDSRGDYNIPFNTSARSLQRQLFRSWRVQSGRWKWSHQFWQCWCCGLWPTVPGQPRLA